MSRTETNQRKREEIKAIMAALLARGWTALRLAAYTGHSTSCISSWKLGKSMGTNDERAELAALAAADSPDVVSAFKAKLQLHRVRLAEAKAARAKVRTPEFLADARVNVVNGHIEMVAYYENGKPKGRSAETRQAYQTEAESQKRFAELKAWDAKQAAEHRATLANGAELDEEAADRVERAVANQEATIEAENEYVALLEKALASYK